MVIINRPIEIYLKIYNLEKVLQIIQNTLHGDIRSTIASDYLQEKSLSYVFDA